MSHTRRLLVVGHFAERSIGANGQVAMTRVFRDELRQAMPSATVRSLDFGVPQWRLPSLFGRLWLELARTDVLVVLPGPRAVTWILPQCAAWRAVSRGEVHVIAVGGWLARLAQTSAAARRNLQLCDGIYVQSHQMAKDFAAMGLRNAQYFPNARRFDSVRKPVLAEARPLRAVFLSRVIPAKGVEVAVHSVLAANRSRPGCCTLDVYGPVGTEDHEWFASLERGFGSSVRYRGVVPLVDAQRTLHEYDVLVFPTTYAGEGFAGVIVEAMIAGLTILTSDWLSNAEVVDHGRNGFVLPAKDADAFAAKLLQLDLDRQLLLRLQQQAAQDACNYHPDAVMPILLDRIGCREQKLRALR